MSTPAGRSSRMSESTVFGVGWWMSISRLCVRISKCSRESLSLNGPRMTQYTFFSVGSGTGPDTVAPDRCAVSTMERADRSTSVWSYPFSLMRIFCCATVSGSLVLPSLLDDLGDGAGADGAAALADCEAQALVHGDRLDQLDGHLGVVAGHDHLDVLLQLDDAGDVGRAEVELRPVALEERLVTAALVLREDVHLGLELRVRRDRARLREHLAALDLLALDAAEERADVVAGLARVEQLAEHLDAGHDRLRGLLVDADDLDLLAGLDLALLHAAGGDGAAAGDREDVLDGHQERLVDVARGLRDVLVHGRHELQDLRRPLGVALERLQGRAAHDRQVVAGEVVLREQLAHLELDQVEQLLVVDRVGLVQEHDDVRHADLAGEHDVLTRLRHRAVGGGHDQDRAVHLGGARDHVLHVVGMARAVDVGVVAVLGLVLDVGGVDRDPALALLGSLVDLVEVGELRARAVLRKNLGDGSGERRLAMVDVTDGADVEVRLVALELLLGHVFSQSPFRGPTPGSP